MVMEFESELRHDGALVDLERYEVIVRNRHFKNRWTMMFWAENYSNAEEQAEPYLEQDDEIIEINKDYAA